MCVEGVLGPLVWKEAVTGNQKDNLGKKEVDFQLTIHHDCHYHNPHDTLTVNNAYSSLQKLEPEAQTSVRGFLTGSLASDLGPPGEGSNSGW